MTGTRSAEMERCIAECESCRNVCLAAVAHCLDQRARHAESSHIGSLLDCVDMCTTSVNFMLRGSKEHRRVCELCAEICDACAESCERLPTDEVMRDCAKACRRCAEACRLMARDSMQM